MARTVDGTASAAKLEASTARPPGPVPRTEMRTDVPSAHPTSVPEFDCAALAFTTFAFDSHANLPLDLAVPARIAGADTSKLDHAAAFVLMHVDGISSIASIASTAGVPLPEVIGQFLAMLGQGIVAIADRPASEARPPVSGVYGRPPEA